MSELSVEQQFKLRAFETQVSQMSREQAQDMLIKMHEYYVHREAFYLSQLKQQWGIGL